jgi:hypothetical protein
MQRADQNQSKPIKTNQNQWSVDVVKRQRLLHLNKTPLNLTVKTRALNFSYATAQSSNRYELGPKRCSRRQTRACLVRTCVCVCRCVLRCILCELGHLIRVIRDTNAENLPDVINRAAVFPLSKCQYEEKMVI